MVGKSTLVHWYPIPYTNYMKCKSDSLLGLGRCIFFSFLKAGLSHFICYNLHLIKKLKKKRSCLNENILVLQKEFNGEKPFFPAPSQGLSCIRSSPHFFSWMERTHQLQLVSFRLSFNVFVQISIPSTTYNDA